MIRAIACRLTERWWPEVLAAANGERPASWRVRLYVWLRVIR